jgi:hypothetical protein
VIWAGVDMILGWLLMKNAGRERRLVRRLIDFYNQYRMPFQAFSGKFLNRKVI